jgi:hypothetical protein
MNMCFRESIRLNQLMVHFRLNNSGKDIPLGNGEVIPPGAFVAYHTGDVHLDSEIYPNPEDWDPNRYSPEEAQDKKAAHAFVGWGSGKHPCCMCPVKPPVKLKTNQAIVGMRFARFEQNLVTAYFLVYFDFHLEDQHGNKITEAPKVDFNQHTAQKPKARSFLRLTPRRD